MYLLKLLFSQNGNISRLEYLCGVLFTYLIVIILCVVPPYFPVLSETGAYGIFIISCIILYFYCGMAISTKRLRDAKNPSWLLYFIFFPVIDFVLKLYLLLVPSAVMDSSKNIISANQVPPKFSVGHINLHIRPWHRFFARIIDINLITFIITEIVITFYPASNAYLNIQILLISIMSILCWAVIEPIFLYIFGFTLGKYIFNIKVMDLSGHKLNFQQALIRSFSVWAKGYGCGLPFVSFFTLIFSYTRLLNTGTTLWDNNKFIVTHNKIGVIRYSFITLFFILYVSSIYLERLHKI